MAYDLTARLRMVDKMSRPLKKATGQIKQTQRSARGLDGKIGAMGKTMSYVAAGGVAALAGGLATVSGYAVSVGMAFEEQMSKVEAVTQASAGQMAIMTDQAKELGRQTRYSATEAAEGMAFLGQAGLTTAEITKSMPSVLDLAASGQLQLGRAADIASNLMSGFNMEASEMSHISDVLAKSASSSNTSVEQMGRAMSYIAPIAEGLGISMEESAAAVGILSNAGIQGERAGTALRGMLGQLQTATGRTADALKDLGLNAEDVNPSVHSLSEIVKTLKESGATAADAMELVGQEAGPGLAAMLTKGADELEGMTKKFENADGAASEMAKTMNDNLRGRLRELKSAFDGFALDIFDEMRPGLNRLADDAKDFVGVLAGGFAILTGNDVEGVKKLTKVFGGVEGSDKVVSLTGAFEDVRKKLKKVKEAGEKVLGTIKDVGNWIQDNWPAVRETVVGLATATLTLKTQMIAMSIVSTITNLWKAYKATAFATTWAQHGLNAAMRANPVGLVITAITLLVTLGVMLYRNFDTIKAKVMSLWDKMSGWQKKLVFIASGPIGWLIAAGVKLYKNWDVIKERAVQIGKRMKSVFGSVKDFIVEAFYNVRRTITNSINAVVERINGLISKLNVVKGVDIPKIPEMSGPQIPNSMAQKQGLSPMAARGVDGSHSAGLDRVPYDGYVARLHKGERVQTAEEAKASRNGNGGNTLNFYGDMNVREEADIKKIIDGITEELEREGGLVAND